MKTSRAHHPFVTTSESTPAESPETWESLTQDSQASTQSLIEQVIGMSQPVFEHSIFAQQNGQHFSDPNLPPRDRKRILAEALGLDVWDRLLELVRVDIRAGEAEVAVLVARLGDFEADMENAPFLRERLKEAQLVSAAAAQTLAAAEALETAKSAALVEVEQAVRARTALLATKAARQEQLGTFAAQVRTAEEAARAAVALRAELDVLADRIVPLDALEAQLREGEAAVASFAAVQAQRAQGLAQVETLRREAKANSDTASAYVLKRTETQAQHNHLERDGAGTCRECGQPLKGEALEAALAVLAAEIQSLGEQAKVYTDASDAKMLEAQEIETRLPEERAAPEDLSPLRAEVAEARQAQVALAGAQ